MTTSSPVARLGLVGSGPALVRAIEAFKAVPQAVIVVVADSGQSEGARLARSLSIPLVTNPMEVYRTNADLIIELNGDSRLYERLLAVKPPGIEVMSVRGARLLIDLFMGSDGSGSAGAPPKRALVVVAAERLELYEYLRERFEGIRGVEVRLDRRQGERRQRLRAQASERRQTDRRSQPGIDAELRSRGFAIVHVQSRVS